MKKNRESISYKEYIDIAVDLIISAINNPPNLEMMAEMAEYGSIVYYEEYHGEEEQRIHYYEEYHGEEETDRKRISGTD